MQHIIGAHLLMAQQFRLRGHAQGAIGEVEAGLVHANACGYGLLKIELLIELARIHLAWPNAAKAAAIAHQAVDLACEKDCAYAWGYADAADVWGQACLADGDSSGAALAFSRAGDVRRSIEHPGASASANALASLNPDASH